MKRIIVIALCLMGSCTPSKPGYGGDRQFVDVPVAVAVGVPVAEIAPVGYSYIPQPTVVVNIDIDSDALYACSGTLDALPVNLGIMDFAFMGGSMGSVVGEKLTRAIEEATRQKLPLVIVSGS